MGHVHIITEERHVSDDLMFQGVPIFIAVVFAIIVVAVLVAVVKGLAQWSRNNASPVLTEPAAVTGKRTAVSGGHGDTGASTAYHATFELPDRTRIELLVGAREYAQLAQGDRGQLTYQGTRYQGFQREGAAPAAR